MTTFLGGGTAAVKRRTPTPASALRIQTSANGVPRPFGYGQARISSNLLDAPSFNAVAMQESGGAKGTGSGLVTTGYNYSATILFGICEGPIDGIVGAWNNKNIIDLAQAPNGAWSAFDGSYNQQPWPLLTQDLPSHAQTYRGISYAAVSGMPLGDSPDLPNMTFEVKFAIADALSEFVTVPAASPYTVTAQYFNWDYGVVEHAVVPVASPYVVDALVNPINVSVPAYVIAGGTTNAFFNTSAQGVVYDDGATNAAPGTPLARVTGTPSQGQYNFTAGNSVSGDYFTFSVADAGQPVAIIDAAIAPGVYYVAQPTATLSQGSAVLTGLSTVAGIAVGSRVVGGAGIPAGAFVTQVSGGSATGTVTSGSTTVGNVFGSFAAAPGTSVSDSAGAIPLGTTVAALTPPAVTMSAPSSGTLAQDTLSVAVTTGGTLIDDAITVSSSSGIVAGALVNDLGGTVTNLAVAAISGTTVILSQGTGVTSPVSDTFTFSTQVEADVTSGSVTLGNVSSLAPLVAGAAVSDRFGSIPPGTSIASSTGGSITLSQAATANASGDTLSFGASLTLSQAATASGSETVSFRGARLTQVLASPSQSEFVLSVQAGSFGQYSFSAADAGALLQIVDLPDANPADVLYDFLSNPFYGVTQFDPSRIGDLSSYRNYCRAAGLLVSPTISTQAQANQFLADLLKATNSELVWSAGKLTVVPYGDAALNANGAAYSPASQPIYALDDDDFLDGNQATNPRSVASAATPDPVTVTRTDIADRENDIKLEYLDRANAYNPTIVEAKDDAAIDTFGMKNSGSRQMHIFCNATAALNGAQLLLGRQSVLRSFAFTLDRKYILLDPMDIVSITDANAGLQDQWVRIKEITENDDRSLSVIAEEYLEGTGSAPVYGHQRAVPGAVNYNVMAPNAIPPMFLDAPVQIGNVLGMETILCTNGAGPNWGGADIWVASDNVNFKYAGTLTGGTTMGTLTASFGSGSDPDTTNTLAVDLTETQGILFPGTQADANQGNTLCLVDQELVTYEQATLTGQWKYNLGKSGSNAGYLRRGFYGTPIAAHAAGAPFARLRPGSYFTLGYDSGDVGETIYVKLLSFNQWGGGRQTLDQVSSTSHTLAKPPVPSSGLLSGIIQTPDIALGAVTTSLIAPGALTLSGLSAAAGVYGITLAWTAASSISNAQTEIWRSASASFSGASRIATAPANTTTWIDQTVASNTQYWYWVRSVDYVGDEGAYTPASSGAGATAVTGLVQTADLAPNAATNQVTASQPNHVALPVSPSTATLVSASLTTIGGVVQIAYNTQFINQSASGAETALWQLLYGTSVLDSGSITVQASAAATIAKQTSFTAPVGSGTFSLVAQGQGSGDAYLIAVLSDLSATEIRR